MLCLETECCWLMNWSEGEKTNAMRCGSAKQTKPIWGPLEFKKIGGERRVERTCLAFCRATDRVGAGTRNLGEMLLMCLCRKKVQKGEQLVNWPFHVTRHSGNPTDSFNGSWISNVGRPHLSPKMCFSLLCPADRLQPLPQAAYQWAHLHTCWCWAEHPWP